VNQKDNTDDAEYDDDDNGEEKDDDDNSDDNDNCDDDNQSDDVNDDYDNVHGASKVLYQNHNIHHHHLPRSSQ
jgi:hypothetical protein